MSAFCGISVGGRARHVKNDLVGKRGIREGAPYRRAAFDEQPCDAARDERFHDGGQPERRRRQRPTSMMSVPPAAISRFLFASAPAAVISQTGTFCAL